MNFDTLWLSGAWRKVGRREAATRFSQQVKTDQDWADINAARDEYNRYCMSNKWYVPQQGATWFGKLKGWRNWIPDRAEALEDDPLPEWKTVHTHQCNCCSEEPHFWSHDDPFCFISHDCICDKGLAERKARQGVK